MMIRRDNPPLRKTLEEELSLCGNESKRGPSTQGDFESLLAFTMLCINIFTLLHARFRVAKFSLFERLPINNLC